MNFKERILGENADTLVEEAQKTFSPKFSKGAANAAANLGSRLPAALGGNALKAYSANVGQNRRELASSLVKTRAKGNIGRITAREQSSTNNPKATFKDTGMYKRLSKGGIINAGRNDRQIRAIANNDSALFGSSAGPSVAESLMNKAGRGSATAIGAGGALAQRLGQHGAQGLETMNQKVRDIMFDPSKMTPATQMASQSPGSAARPI